jgi:hypothetical protein
VRIAMRSHADSTNPQKIPTHEREQNVMRNNIEAENIGA